MAFSLCFLVRHCEALSRCRASPRGCELLPIFNRGLKRAPPQPVHANFPYGLEPSVAIILGSELVPFVGDRYPFDFCNVWGSEAENVAQGCSDNR